MDKNLTSLKPALVWKHFAEICNIPHPSHSEEKIRQYVVDFAVAHSIEHQVDEAGNVYMRKAATAGMEDRKYNQFFCARSCFIRNYTRF